MSNAKAILLTRINRFARRAEMTATNARFHREKYEEAKAAGFIDEMEIRLEMFTDNARYSASCVANLMKLREEWMAS